MAQKLKDFCESVLSTRGITWISIIVFIAVSSFILITDFDDMRTDITTYPEEEYRLLEAEAEKLISNKDFETDFSYDIQITNTEKTKKLKIDLISETSIARVMINSENFDSQDPTVTVKRLAKTPYIHYIFCIIVFICIIMMITCVIDCIVAVPFIVIWCVLWIYLHIKKWFKPNSAKA